MKEEQIGMIVMGFVFLGLGVTLLASYGIASWGINNTRMGRVWGRLFGEERAVMILRFVAGPLLIALSAFGIWMGLSNNVPS